MALDFSGNKDYFLSKSSMQKMCASDRGRTENIIFCLFLPK